MVFFQKYIVKLPDDTAIPAKTISKIRKTGLLSFYLLFLLFFFFGTVLVTNKIFKLSKPQNGQRFILCKVFLIAKHV